jgi:uncharacterized protein YjbJ (UPF0337 family)
MSNQEGKYDDAKGRVKEAVGALTDDEKLQREGKLDRAAGKAKEAAGKAKDKAEDVVDAARDKLKRR